MTTDPPMKWKWNAHKIEVEGFPKHVGPTPGHLTECLVVAYATSGLDPTEHWPHCTCDDWSPE